MSKRNAVGAAASPSRHAQAGELYREIFRRSIDGIAIIDRNGFYVEQNAAHEELTGYTDGDLHGETPAVHLGPSGFTKIVEGLAQFGAFRGVLESRTKSGEVKKIDLSAFPVYDTAGTPVYLVGIKRDITENERVAAERDARLRELESLYGLTKALNHAHRPEQIYNAAMEALINVVGADRASVLAYDDDNLMHFKAWSGLSEEYRAAVDGHSPWTRDERNASIITVPNVFEDPELKAYTPVFVTEGIYSVAFIPIEFEGQLLGKFMVYYNQPHAFTPEELRMADAVSLQIAVVMQRSFSEEALRRSEKLATVGKLAATVAHEINNPLESIMNLAFLLRHAVAGDRVAARYLDELENELKRVSMITRRTLAFYRDSEPHGRVELGPLIEEIVTVFRPKMETAQIELGFSAEKGAFVHGSAGEMRQVFLNLLANAMEAIGTNGRIDVTVRIEGEFVEAKVADNGPGIPESKANRIFEPFFTTKAQTGTGLGLALSKEIVERHQGTIGAGNRAEGGAVMTVRLPRSAS